MKAYNPGTRKKQEEITSHTDRDSGSGHSIEDCSFSSISIDLIASNISEEYSVFSRETILRIIKFNTIVLFKW